MDISVETFLRTVEDGSYSKIEVYNYIDKITDSFRVDKLKVLLEDIEDTIIDRENGIRESWEISMPRFKAQQTPYNFQKEGKTYDLHEELQFLIHTQLEGLYSLRDTIEEKIRELAKPNKASIVTRPEVGIEQFLNEEGRKHLPIIRSLYKQVKQKGEYVSMIFALGELGLLIQPPLQINRTALHRALVSTFGESVGGRANINHHFIETNPDLPFVKSEINKHKLLIQKAIK